MNSFETVYNELEELLIKKLPEYIEKINKQHNDGLILKPFENTSLEENCIKTPSFMFNIEESEYSEKDRIIETTIFTIGLEINLPPYTKNQNIIIWRYAEALQKMYIENDNYSFYKLKKIKENKIFTSFNLLS